MNEIEFHNLMETAWQRPLAADELARVERWCQLHPERRKEVELDLAASSALHGLPEVEVPSNFMARVWSEVDRSEALASTPEIKVRSRATGWNLASLLRASFPRFAAATLIVVGGGTLGWQGYRSNQRTEVAAGVTQVMQASSIPDPEMLQVFDTLQVMVETPTAVDVDLLAALQ